MNTTTKETDQTKLKTALEWWEDLETQWKIAFNQAYFQKEPTEDAPTDEDLIALYFEGEVFRFAGPTAANPNIQMELTNLSGLIALNQMKYLSITNVKLDNLKELIEHIHLENLFVYENGLTSLEGIEKMVHLKSLYFHNNKIASLTPLKNLINLETVFAFDNELTNLDGISEDHADNLTAFYIQPNEGLRDRDIIKFQNSVGIICRKG